MPILEARKFSGELLVRILVVSIFIMAFFAVVLTFFVARHRLASIQKDSLPVYGEVADFSFTERSGKPFSLKDLDGMVWVANFMFTHCPGQCPRMSLEVSRLQGKLPQSVRFVSFTADPERDTPEVLSQYAETYHSEKDRWFFLTGAKDNLNQVAASLYMSLTDDPNEHSVRLVLIDREGKIRGYYDPIASPSLAKLLEDARTLLEGR